MSYKARIENYVNRAYQPNIDSYIIVLTKEGVGVRSIARILKISNTTLLKRIITIAKNIRQPIISKGKTYEVDKMCTYIRNMRNLV